MLRGQGVEGAGPAQEALGRACLDLVKGRSKGSPEGPWDRVKKAHTLGNTHREKST